MSMLVRFPSSNVSRQQYDSVRSALEEAGDFPADGLQLHVAFGSDDDVRVSEVWESKEKFEAFGEKLRPLLEENDIQLAGDPEFFDVVNVVTT
jgi:hypothetical protein